jgi:hypothetical protein
LDLHFDPFVHLHQKLSQRSMTDRLEMLSQREQLMEDIDSIISGFFNDTYEGQYPEECEDLTRILCDAVCRNFPAN